MRDLVMFVASKYSYSSTPMATIQTVFTAGKVATVGPVSMEPNSETISLFRFPRACDSLALSGSLNGQLL